MKTPKIELGLKFPYFYRDRIVNAEIVEKRKEGHRFWWKVRLSEGGSPIRTGGLHNWAVEFEARTANLSSEVTAVERAASEQRAATSERLTVRYVRFPESSSYSGIWVEHRSDCNAPTRWARTQLTSFEDLDRQRLAYS